MSALLRGRLALAGIGPRPGDGAFGVTCVASRDRMHLTGALAGK